MKPFIAAIISLVLTVSLVAVNGIFSTAACEEFLSEVENAPNADGENMNGQALHFENLRQRWDKEKKFISISVNHGVIEEIDGYIAAIIGACRAGDRGEYAVNKEKAAAAFENLRDLAAPSIENII